MDPILQYQADRLAAKIKHYLITSMGRVNEQANDEEFYRAFAYALREEIMINWLASVQTRTKKDVRTIYYLSLEYLPGRIFKNNITNIGAEELISQVMQMLNRRYHEILEHEPDPGLGNGGLGRLASCFLDSMASQHYPAHAYGLRYQYGIFEQEIKNGEQVEAPDLWLIREYPWEFRRDLRKQSVKFCGRSQSETNIHGDEIYSLNDFDEVWALPYDVPIVGYNNGKEPFSVVTLRLWSTKESPRNFRLQRYNAGRLDEAAENTALTDVLYPSDYHETGKKARVKQEFLLVSASLQDIIRRYLNTHKNFRDFQDKVVIQINETHPALVIPELIRLLTAEYDLPWRRAVEITQQCVGYTNHTIMREALEHWDQGLIHYLLPRQAKIIERLNQEFCDSVRDKYPGDEERVRRMSIIEGGQMRMAHLAIVGSHSINGVAKLHTEILKNEVFKDFYEMYPERFHNITNGVTQRRWLLHCNPELAGFISKRIGTGWITDFSILSKLGDYARDPESQREFLNIKRKNKERLIDELSKKNSEEQEFYPIIDPNSIFDMQIKRIHEYKRQLMNALHILMVYNEIKENPSSTRLRRTFFISGKAAASYDAAKNIILLINCIARKVNHDPAIGGRLKVVFVENYNVSKASILMPACDLSEQISTAGMEASGTGNMKLAINGALTIGTHDGANIEMEEAIGSAWWPFKFGLLAEEIEKERANYNPWEVCSAHPEIQRVVEMLRDHSLTQNEQEDLAFCSLHKRLFEGEWGSNPDYFFVLKDLWSYYETQKKVEELYAQPTLWAEYCLHNIAGMGIFSSDRAVQEYAQKIWNITPCHVDPEVYERVHFDYSEYDKCRIY